MDHVILTRFNLPSVGAESIVRARHGWLTQRVELFERYCLPSVRAQTHPGVKWVIYFDPESPDWLKERIVSHAEAGYYVPIFRTQVDRAELIGDIASLFEVRGDELLTTNLDNDDALAVDFAERLRAQPRPAGKTAYYLRNGLVKSGDNLFIRRDPRNAYPSIRESWDAPITCWADWHTRLTRHASVIEIGGAPGWLQVVHGGNVSNRTRGRLISPSTYRPLFGDLLDDVAEPASAALARDRLVGHPRRVARDWARRASKTVAMRLLGPDGFEHAKRLLATRTRV